MKNVKTWTKEPITKGGLLKAYGICTVASLLYTAVTMKKLGKMFNHGEVNNQEEKHDEK